VTNPAAWWRSFWFSSGDPRNLAAARIIVAMQALWMLLSRDLPALTAMPAPFWQPVRLTLARRYLLIPDMLPVERTMEAMAIIALIMVAVGVFARMGAMVAALALYHLAPLQTLPSTVDPINRGFTTAVVCLVVLAASPCCDRWALRRPRSTAATWEYGWPLRLMWLFIAEIYLFGAVGKLHISGLAWFTARNLGRTLALYPHMYPGVSDGLIASLLARPSLLGATAWCVLLLEGGFILTLFSRRARRVLVPAALAMHLMILRIMRGVFANMAHLGLFVNWGWIADRLLPTSDRQAS
jgi:hypothetical protein